MKYLLQTHPGPNPCSEASQSPQDLTPCPYSAVSSFNLPSYCDSTLITPITMSQSVAIGTKTAPAMRSDADIKLSPSIMSPTYYFLGGDNEYNGERYYDCLPMKHKSRSGDFHLSTLDSLFPASPYTCPEPYFGAYGVSATPTSEYSDSSPSLVRSPAQLSSTSGLSNYCNSSPSQSSLPTPVPEVTYRSQMRAPLLIAPNPSTLRSATKQDSGSYRQNSLQSISGTVVHALLPEPRLSRSLPIRSRKRKSPSRDESERNIELSGEMTENEELLIELSHKERRPWAEIQRIFNEKTNSNVSIATLQMRKTRLIKRIRVWTDEDVRALTLAVQEVNDDRWDVISMCMMSHGCKVRWPRDRCEKKWQEMHPQLQDRSNSPHRTLEYEVEVPPHFRFSADMGPDGRLANSWKSLL